MDLDLADVKELTKNSRTDILKQSILDAAKKGHTQFVLWEEELSKNDEQELLLKGFKIDIWDTVMGVPRIRIDWS